MQKLFWLSFLIFYVTPLIYNVLLDVREGEKPSFYGYVPILNAYLMWFANHGVVRGKLTLYFRYGVYRFCGVMIWQYLKRQKYSKMQKWSKIRDSNNEKLKAFGERQRERINL